MNGRKWKKVKATTSAEIKGYLSELGGKEEEVRGAHESWRIRLVDATFTFYATGTLYSTPSNSGDPLVAEVWKKMDRLLGSQYVTPTRDLLIGMDETGKGEVIGPTVLTGVIFPGRLFREIDLIIGPADTKNRHGMDFWLDLYQKLSRLRDKEFDFITEEISPAQVDEYKLNQMMDVTYQNLLEKLLEKAEVSRCRVVIDDYGVGTDLRKFLQSLESRGTEIAVEVNSEDTYLETKAASIISKRQREATIEEINKNSEFQIGGISVGSGNTGDETTRTWLKNWYEAGRPWPWFVKRSFKTIREIEGKTTKIKKSPLKPQ